ncbi:MAG: terminase family protein [Gordonia sp. (in: high G+C Gram-positive bacteria)]
MTPMTSPETAARVALRREATERVLAEHGVQEWIGPAALAETVDPRRFWRRPHTNVINAALAQLLIEPGGALMVETPPRVGKSMLVSQFFPFWWLTMRPSDRMVLSSYAESLALRHSVAARGLVQAYGTEYGLELSKTQAEKRRWDVTDGGGMIARGVSSGLTGEDMDLGIIDDPVKDRAAAESELVRDAAWDWYSSTFGSRRMPETREVVCMTRWRKDDLAGRILDAQGRVEEGGRWRVVHLPALALPENHERGVWADPLGRSPGEPLTHPRIDPADSAAMLEHWEKQRARSTSRDWNALYQGVPYDAEGALLAEADLRAATGRAPTSFRRVCVAVDPAGGGRDTVGVVAVGLDEAGRVWFVQDRTRRMPADEWPRVACQLAEELDAGEIVVEKNFGGDMATTLVAQAWQQLQRDGAVRGLCPMIREVTARRSKVLRAEPIAQAVKTGRVWFVPGLPTLVNEFQMWTPGSTWSPGALDAAVHGATHLLPTLPRGARLTDAAGLSRAEVAAQGLAGRTIGDV